MATPTLQRGNSHSIGDPVEPNNTTQEKIGIVSPEFPSITIVVTSILGLQNAAKLDLTLSAPPAAAPDARGGNGRLNQALAAHSHMSTFKMKRLDNKSWYSHITVSRSAMIAST